MNSPSMMKKMRKVLPFMLAVALTCACIPMAVKADSSKVVTLGANLSEEQKTSMYEYFGTSADKVETIQVTNADERKYMEGIASEEQIGTRTYSCSYVEPTSSGGIQVKVANLTFVTSSMIASTLLTSGVENCNVVAASPIEVSGTGALTGIMMAYENASGEELSEAQKETATQELITTGQLADEVGEQQATNLMNAVKKEVIEEGLSDPAEIQSAVDSAAQQYNITLTEEQMSQIVSLMESISQFDYDVNALKDTLDNLAGKEDGFFANLWNSIKSFFGGNSEGGIINDTQDDVLGAGAVIDSTLDAVKNEVDAQDGEGLWDKIVNFFKGLFGGEDEEIDENTDTGSDAETASDANASSDVDSASEADSANDADTADHTDMTNGTDTSNDSTDTDTSGASGTETQVETPATE